MKKSITRRDFLKLAGIVPLSVAAPRLVDTLVPVQQSGKAQNVIVIVFDAFSAYNISLYGYQRETTPNIARWAEQAVVYHNHFAGGNSTMPGTASLLTGTLPWKHRAFGLDKKMVEESFVEKNIFSAFQNHYRLSYTHNPVANRLLTQFEKKTDEHIPLGRLYLAYDDFINTIFNKDEDTATVSWVRAMKNKEEGFAYSLFLSHLYGDYRNKIVTDLRSQYPDGLPYFAGDDYFLLEDAFDFLSDTVRAVPQPFIGYFHFLPPHAPYKTHKDFNNIFAHDGFQSPFKPPDLFSDNEGNGFLANKRREYDQFILYVDREFGRFMDKVEKSGLLENTWVILTSDHGEMFERGIRGHLTPVLYNPVVRVPLLIFVPGQKRRTNIYSNTSAVDVLPTLLHVTGHQPANWSEGTVLPPFQPVDPEQERELYVLQARRNAQYEPLTVSTIVQVKGRYKLMYFFGYEELSGKERIELYDIEKDPDELNDLYLPEKDVVTEMLGSVKAKLLEVNQPYL